MVTNLRIPAAQYLRMSSEHQQYSLDNQTLALQIYAEKNGFVIAQTYTDGARSGIVLRHRDGLRQLLNDVVSGIAAFKAILVYDVSRWGRFQDSDEAAHYEFLCRSAGIPVHYCAEPFANDGTPLNTLLKTIKRTMAAEYSRELGVKIADGQRTVFLRGFRGSGSYPGFALRRMLVSPDGMPKQILAPGERKALQTDRVILVPGPGEEVAWLREIFRLFTEEKLNYRAIAEILNENGVPYRDHRPWNFYAVRYLLTSTKYNGSLIYGKWTRRLHTKSRKTPESQWLRVPHPTSKLIDDATFQAAGARIKCFTINKSNDELLGELQSILAANGKLSAHIIRRTPGATPPTVYRYRFGSLVNAFHVIGYTPYASKIVATRRRVEEMRTGLLLRLQQMFPDDLSIRGWNGITRNWLQLRNGTRISVRFCIQPVRAPLVRMQPKPAWVLRRIDRESNWPTLIALLNKESTEIERLLVYPRVPQSAKYVPVHAPWLKQGIELDDLRSFCDVVANVLAAPR